MFYIFKMNLGAKQMNSFEGDTDQLNKIILHALSMAFEVIKVREYYKINFYPDRNQDKFNTMIAELRRVTDTLNDLYINTIEHYNDTGEIKYPKDFVPLNKKCGKLRNKLEREFPILDSAFDYSDEDIISLYNIPMEYQIGKGKNHLVKFKKIEKFIKDNNIEENINKSPTIYYDNNEHFFIKAVNEAEAEQISKDIVMLLSKNKLVTEHLGLINILPIFDDIEIEGNTNKITYAIVYPNGSKERHEKILDNQLKQLEESDGDDSVTTISGQNQLDLGFFNKLFKYVGRKGYLKKIELPKSAKVIRKIKKTYIDDEP